MGKERLKIVLKFFIKTFNFLYKNIREIIYKFISDLLKTNLVKNPNYDFKNLLDIFSTFFVNSAMYYFLEMSLKFIPMLI